jgi:hypothetical protein
MRCLEELQRGDRLIDWNGAYNLFTHCNAAYGGKRVPGHAGPLRRAGGLLRLMNTPHQNTPPCFVWGPRWLLSSGAEMAWSSLPPRSHV